MGAEIKIAIVEDQQHTRDGLAMLIGGTAGYRITGSFGTMEEALEKLPGDPPDVLLSDIGLPGVSGIEGVRRLRASFPAMQVVMLTVHGDDDHLFEAICAGACGYLLKETPPARLLEAIREVHTGGAPMSPEVARKVVVMFQKIVPPKAEDDRLSARELELLKLLAEGHSYKTAAHALSLSIDGIRFHVRNIYERLHVHSKSDAVLKALRSGLIR
jgi:DNA-binding NarL/FixJ family response regulator